MSEEVAAMPADPTLGGTSKDADARVDERSDAPATRTPTDTNAAPNERKTSESAAATSTPNDTSISPQPTEAHAIASGDSASFEREFSAAQLQAKVRQARLEAKIAADEQALALRKRIVDLEHETRELQRASKQAAERHQHLQSSVDVILSAHKRTLNGMRDDLQVDTLVAALEVEKAAREKLHAKFERQNAQLLAAEARAEALSAQVLKHQKTETVLAQSISHFQHRFDNKDQKRVASLERVRLEMEETHRRDTEALRREVEIASRAEQLAQEQLLALEKKLRALQESAKATSALQQQSGDAEQALRARIEQLETEKAVLVRKAEQLQRADGQLRSKMRALEDDLLEKRNEIATLREEAKELTSIASDLMEMAEKNQQEKRLQKGLRDEDAEFLATRKKRLRMSIG